MESSHAGWDPLPPVRCYLTTNGQQLCNKIARQLTELGASAVEVRFEQNKVFFSCSPNELPALQASYGVERIFLCLIDRAVVDDECPLFGTPPDFGELARWFEAAGLDAAAAHWATLHGRRAQTWALAATRRGSKASRCRQNLDQLELLLHAREAVGLLLPGIEPVRHTTGAAGAASGTPPDLSLELWVSPARVVAGVLLYVKRVKRGFIPHKGLHHSVSWGLGLTARLQPGDVVLDLCCGTAAALVEMAEYWPAVTYIGADLDETQLSRAAANLDARRARVGRAHTPVAAGTPAAATADSQTRSAAAPAPRGGGGTQGATMLELLRADGAKLPLRAGTVDAVVSDLPFGRQHGSAEGNRSLYPSLLREIGRALCPQRGRAVLLTAAACVPPLIEPDALAASTLVHAQTVPMRFCNIDCAMVLLHKAGADGGLFDTTFSEHAAGDKSYSWKREKPVLVARVA